MDINFILTQVFGIIALVFVCIAYFMKNRSNFLVLQIISSIFYSGAFLFQDLLVAGFGTIISLLRTISIYLFVKAKKEPPFTYLSLIFAAYFINASIFSQTLFDLIALSADCIFAVALVTANLKATHYMMVFANILQIIYNIFNLCYTNAMLDLIETIVGIISVIMFEIALKKKKTGF